MFYIVATGGKQYLVRPGQIITVERLNANVGDTVELPVLMSVEAEDADDPSVDLVVTGKPRTVAATVVEHTRSAKIPVVKFKRKVRYRRTKSHRQQLSVVRIIPDVLRPADAPAPRAS